MKIRRISNNGVQVLYANQARSLNGFRERFSGGLEALGAKLGKYTMTPRVKSKSENSRILHRSGSKMTRIFELSGIELRG